MVDDPYNQTPHCKPDQFRAHTGNLSQGCVDSQMTQSEQEKRSSLYPALHKQGWSILLPTSAHHLLVFSEETDHVFTLTCLSISSTLQMGFNFSPLFSMGLQRSSQAKLSWEYVFAQLLCQPWGQCKAVLLERLASRWGPGESNFFWQSWDLTSL